MASFWQRSEQKSLVLTANSHHKHIDKIVKALVDKTGLNKEFELTAKLFQEEIINHQNGIKTAASLQFHPGVTFPERFRNH